MRAVPLLNIRFQAPLRGPVQAGSKANSLVQTLYVISLVDLQLTAGLLGAWSTPLQYVLIPHLIVFAMLMLTPSMRKQQQLANYQPVAVLAIAILTISAAAIAYTYTNAPQNVISSAINGFAYSIYVVVITAFLFWDARSRYADLALKHLLGAFLTGLIIYCLLQIIMLFLMIYNPGGVNQPQINGDAVFAKILGFNNSRQMLPISSAFQAGGAIPLAVSVAALSRLLNYRQVLFSLIVFLIGIYLLLLLDVQQFILAVFFTGFLVTFVRSPLIFALISAILPWSYVVFVGFGQYMFPFLLRYANARGSNRFGLFTGREFIWEGFGNYFIDASYTQIIFGNGFYGQSASRLIDKYAVMFGSFPPEQRYLAGLHNSYLQVIVDNGLLGLGCYMAIIGFTAYRALELSRLHSPSAGAWRTVAMLVSAFAFGGASEVALTFYMKEAVVITIFAITAIAMCGGETVPRTAQVTPAPARPGSVPRRPVRRAARAIRR